MNLITQLPTVFIHKKRMLFKGESGELAYPLTSTTYESYTK